MIYILVALISVILDQVTKSAVLANFKVSQSKPVIDKILYLTYVTNKGGAFGMMSGHTFFFVFLAIILCLAGIVFIPKILKMPKSIQVALGLLLGGTIGNLIDRLRFKGAVIDFIDFRVWPTFNVADIAICVGVGMIVFLLFTTRDDKENKESENTLTSSDEVNGESGELPASGV
ncbi:MAG: signal peptidase II [Firmicutes bacterium]|nr:signal peptidase II [Bacillota bacterium]